MVNGTDDASMDRRMRLQQRQLPVPVPDAQAKGLKPLRIPHNIFEQLVMSAFPSVDKLSRLKWIIIDHKLPESAYRKRDNIE